MLVNDEGRRIRTAIRWDFTGSGHEMAGKKNPRELGINPQADHEISKLPRGA